MATLVLVRGIDPDAVESRRCGVFVHLLAHVRAFALDRALARGASPDSCATLSVRAQRLIGATHRRGLARDVRSIVKVASRSPHPFDPTVRVPPDVLLVRDWMEEVAEILAGPVPVDPRGVAQVELLLCDGDGPMYRTGGAPALRQSLEQIIDALELPPTILTDA